MNFAELGKKAKQIRLRILDAIMKAGKGHIGGAYSCTDILVALFHGGYLKFQAKNPGWDKRDRFILSKGHSAIALFAVLADVGFFEVSELDTVCKDGSRLGEHPDRGVPGIEVDTGSLGHGLGIGVGMALGAKLDGKDHVTMVLLGDGECYEGTIWEALLLGAHLELGNLIAVIDRNQQLTLDYTENCNRLDPFKEKLTAFGWDTVEIDGHSFEELGKTFSSIRDRKGGKPLAVIARTIKGKGVSFMEGSLKWHHGMPSNGEAEVARRELGSEGPES